MEANDESVDFATLSLEGDAQEIAAAALNEVAGESDPAEEVAEEAYKYNNRKGAESLILEASERCIEGVRRLLEGGADPNYVQANGKTALSEAAGNGDIDVAEALIEAGANVDGPVPVHLNQYVPVPLIHAVFGRKCMTVKLLLEAGANVNAEDNFGMTALFYAARYGYVELLKPLLAAGSSRKYVDGTSSDNNPLMAALRFSKAQVVKFLINAGANVNVRNQNGRTPLIVVAARTCEPKDIELVDLLISREADVNAIDSDGCSALHYFARRGSTDMCYKLIAAGANVWCRGNFQGQGSLTALELVPTHKTNKKKYRKTHHYCVTIKMLEKAMRPRCIAAALSVLGDLPEGVLRRIIQLYYYKTNLSLFKTNSRF